jgi:D-xylose transport system substrate-binding protein
VRSTQRRALISASAAVLAIGLLAGCGSSKSSSSSSSSGSGNSGKSGTIALLLPETKTTRYEAADKPMFTAKVQALCPNCKVDYQNANQDSAQQLNQAQTALTNGAKVLVLDPVDGKAAASIVTAAKAQNVPVISYDRLANGPVDYYVSFDNNKVGQLQGQALLDAMNKAGTTSKGSIVMINGSPTDPNAADFKKGAHSVLDGKVTIGKEYDTPDWSNDKAQDEMQQAITALGKDKIVGVYAANDGTAGGAYAAMSAAGINPIPPLTGQDAQVDGIQRVLAGQQYMTVYKAIKPEAEDAATLAVQLVQGTSPSIQGMSFTTSNNGTADVKSVLLTPVAVTKDNVKSTVVADGFLTAAQICTSQYASACQAAGIS